MVTRSLDQAKEWLRLNSRGSEGMGVIASSGGHRLKPSGIYVKSDIEPKTWFLNNSCDIRSAGFLEEVATEFEIQGLELDWVCVAWDADFSRSEHGWVYRNFRGTSWNNVRLEERKRYLKNAYRVLLTRARQGMVIFVPEGSNIDSTRSPKYYDSVYRYILECGIPKL